MFVLQLSLPLSSPSHSILKKLHSALIQLLPSRHNEYPVKMSCMFIRRAFHRPDLVLTCLRLRFSAAGSEMSESPAGSPVPTTPPSSPSKSTPPSSPKKAGAAAKNAAKKEEAKKSKEVEKIKKWRAVQRGKIIKVGHRPCFSLVPRSRARLN